MKKFLLALRLFALAIFCALFPQSRAAFTLNVTASPSTVSSGGTVTYSITVSNTLNLVQGVQVVSQFPTDATVVSAANNYSPGFVTTNSGQVVFTINDIFPTGVPANFTLQLQPASGASFTNLFTVQGGSETPVSTNVVVALSAPGSDLGIASSGLPPTAVIGDVFSYTLTVTNAGPADAKGVNIQSQISTNMSVVSIAPTVPFSSLNGVLTLTPGTLPAGTNSSFVVTLQALTNGDFNLSTSVTTIPDTDPDPTDNTASSSIHILSLATNTVAIVSASPMVFNYQTALLEQVVVVSNLTSAVIDSVRVMATNLVAPNKLFNATGTNSGHPYVVIGSRLGVGGTATVNLQFFVTNRTVIDAGLVAVEGPSLVTIPVPTGTFIPVTSVSQIRNGGFSSILLQFPTTVGRKYSLVYSPTVDGTNRVALFPPFVANSVRGQFIDSGPQAGGNDNRFYSVIEQP